MVWVGVKGFGWLLTGSVLLLHKNAEQFNPNLGGGGNQANPSNGLKWTINEIQYKFRQFNSEVCTHFTKLC